LNTAIDGAGRVTDTRSDLANAFGDWDSIREQVAGLAGLSRVDRDVAAALRSAEQHPGGCTDDQYLALATADGPGLDAVAALADDLRAQAVGGVVTYVVNRNINFTNICYTGAASVPSRSARAMRTPLPCPPRRSPTGRGKPMSPAPPRSACRAGSTRTCR
jgi:hypothetical protein